MLGHPFAQLGKGTQLCLSRSAKRSGEFIAIKIPGVLHL
jgi:hypothetical protein